MENICDLANARTTIPPNLVSVIPDNTELPMLVRTLLEVIPDKRGSGEMRSLPCSLDPVCTHIDRESSYKMTAELHADTHGHHQVDQGHSVQRDVPPVHQPSQVHDDKDDDEKVDD